MFSYNSIIILISFIATRYLGKIGSDGSDCFADRRSLDLRLTELANGHRKMSTGADRVWMTKTETAVYYGTRGNLRMTNGWGRTGEPIKFEP